VQFFVAFIALLTFGWLVIGLPRVTIVYYGDLITPLTRSLAAKEYHDDGLSIHGVIPTSSPE
jgi:hypothetical protein